MNQNAPKENAPHGATELIFHNNLPAHGSRTTLLHRVASHAADVAKRLYLLPLFATLERGEGRGEEFSAFEASFPHWAQAISFEAVVICNKRKPLSLTLSPLLRRGARELNFRDNRKARALCFQNDRRTLEVCCHDGCGARELSSMNALNSQRDLRCESESVCWSEPYCANELHSQNALPAHGPRTTLLHRVASHAADVAQRLYLLPLFATLERGEGRGEESVIFPAPRAKPLALLASHTIAPA